ncbi:MAG: AMP-binding protein [Treponema sp.]|nr:AMP-binding protein [Treponema sp.]
MIILDKLTLGALVLKAAAKYTGKTAFQIYRDNGVYNQVSYSELGTKAKQFAACLKACGVKQSDRVMLLAENRPEWVIAYFGIALAGAVSVPVLVDFIDEQVLAIAGHAEVSAVCVTERTAVKIEKLRGSIPFIILDDPDLLTQDLLTENNPASAEDTANNPAEKNDLSGEDDLASIIYTSGTMGTSKGVALSHRNLVFTAMAARKIAKIYARDRILSVIPLAHTYECTVGLLTPVISGACITYLDRPPSPVILLPAMQTLRPTAIVTVPLFIEKIYRSHILPQMEATPLYKWKLTRLLVIKAAGARLMELMGSSMRFFGVGGAPLADDTEKFLKDTGFPYSIGYGLTETSPLVTGTIPYHFPLRSSGKAIPGVEVRIGDEGEIQVRGPNVMMGYYRDEERTKQAFTDDGWFRTGDLGGLDKKGNLFIRGRLKAVIIGPSGENIYPEEIENILSASFLVEDALVIPGSRGELVALIVLSEKAKTALAALADNIEELKQNVNKRLAAFSRLNRIEIQQEPFEKTPTRKIKRFLYFKKD